MHRSLHVVLIVVLLALAASPAVPATCCCTGKLVPAPFTDGGCCGGSPSPCCVVRAPAPVASQAELAPTALVQPELQAEFAGDAAHRRAPSSLAAFRHPVAIRAPVQRPSLAGLSILRV